MATPNLKDEEPMQIEHTTHDDVFGEITDEGPNYRNVHTYLSLRPALNPMSQWNANRSHSPGRVRGNRYSHDEDSDWHGCSGHPICPGRPGYDPGHYLSSYRCMHHHLVRLYYRRIQASAP